jgi:mono/diheme cytochrome c family protein
MKPSIRIFGTHSDEQRGSIRPLKRHLVRIKYVLIFSALAFVFMSQTGKPKGPAQGGLGASIIRGKQVYLQQCLACHQADASGVPNMNPPLIKTKQVLGDKTALIKIVLNGLSGVAIDGDSYNGVMAAHPDLTDQEIADVLTYVRNSFGNKATAVTAAQVKAVRAADKPAN